VQIKHQWVKGHYKGKRELKHELNHQADELAGEFNKTDRPVDRKPPALSPLYEAGLIHDNQIITSRLAKTIGLAVHESHLRSHIIKRQNWSTSIFDRVDWDAHRMAYTSYKRTQQISISKLVH
jgi:hypothetical protein